MLQRLYGFDGCGCGILSDAHEEIGCDLGISRGTVGYHATRGRQSLRADAQLCEAVGVEPPPEAMKPREVPVSPEMMYAKELAAWKAGHTSYGSLAKALGIGKKAARGCIAKMRKAGLIPEREVPTPTYCMA